MRSSAAALAALLLAGCAHPLEVKNLDRYGSIARGEPLERQTAIGVIAAAPDAESRRLVGLVGKALGKYSAQVVQPYKPGADVEVLARITATPRYAGSGANWFVNFPGLLVLAPSWGGYHYTVDYDFRILLTRAWDNAKIDAWDMPVSLDVRHSDGVTLSADYDPKVTRPTVDEAGEVVADHVARDIVRHLNSEGRLWKLDPPADWVSPDRVTTRPVPPPATTSPVPLAPAPSVPAPVTAPVTSAPPAAAPQVAPAPPPPAGTWATGQQARLRSGVSARVRMAADGDVVEGIEPGAAVTLRGRASREGRTWWYVAAPGGSGWVSEADLEPVTPR